jgi:nitroreductase
MLNDLSSAATLIATRRSGKPRDMIAPGPDEAQLRRILSAAMRVPDHGKLAPWRFVVIGQDRRAAFRDMLVEAYHIERPEPGRLEIEAIEQFAFQAPTLVALLSTPRPESHIPIWEQELSSGAACMALLLAAHAEGFVGCWLSTWAAFSSTVAAGLGHPEAKIAGFLFLGSLAEAPSERPRPAYEDIVSHW